MVKEKNIYIYIHTGILFSHINEIMSFAPTWDGTGGHKLKQGRQTNTYHMLLFFCGT
jgi:hypothetical protein